MDEQRSGKKQILNEHQYNTMYNKHFLVFRFMVDVLCTNCVIAVPNVINRCQAC